MPALNGSTNVTGALKNCALDSFCKKKKIKIIYVYFKSFVYQLICIEILSNSINNQISSQKLDSEINL